MGNIKYKKCLGKNAGTGKCSVFKGTNAFCYKHYGQFRLGIIDKNGNKLRDFKSSPPLLGNKKCLAKGKKDGVCSINMVGRFCKKHYMRYYRGFIDINGDRLREGRVKNLQCILAHSGECSSYYKKGNRFCWRHRHQYEKGLIDINGNVISKKAKIKPNKCILKDSGECSKYEKGRFCNKHSSRYRYGQIDINGKLLRELKSGPPKKLNRKCILEKESKCNGKIIGNFCRKHRGWLEKGIVDRDGNILRKLYTDYYRCGIPGCEEKGGPKSGLCKRHYKDIVSHGNVNKYASLMKAPKGKEMTVQDITWEV